MKSKNQNICPVCLGLVTKSNVKGRNVLLLLKDGQNVFVHTRHHGVREEFNKQKNGNVKI